MYCANPNHLWRWWCCLVVAKQYKSCGSNRIIRLVGAWRVFPQFLEGGYSFFAWAKQNVVFLRSSWVISKTALVPLIMLNFNIIHCSTEISSPQSYSPCNKIMIHTPNSQKENRNASHVTHPTPTRTFIMKRSVVTTVSLSCCYS